MRIRLRGPSGASIISLGEYATVGDLLSQISEKTSLTNFDIKYGYPPKPLHLNQEGTLLSALDVSLDGEQLTISAQDRSTGSGGSVEIANKEKNLNASRATNVKEKTSPQSAGSISFAGMSATKDTENSAAPKKETGPVSLQRKAMDRDVPELPLPDRGATMGEQQSFPSARCCY